MLEGASYLCGGDLRTEGQRIEGKMVYQSHGGCLVVKPCRVWVYLAPCGWNEETVMMVRVRVPPYLVSWKEVTNLSSSRLGGQ